MARAREKQRQSCLWLHPSSAAQGSCCERNTAWQRVELAETPLMSAPPSPITAWAIRVFETLRDREPDPVEALEREAHFETHKAKGAKK